MQKKKFFFYIRSHFLTKWFLLEKKKPFWKNIFIIKLKNTKNKILKYKKIKFQNTN